MRTKERIRRICGVLGLLACSAWMTGCCDEVCDAIGDLKVWIAQNYAICCQGDPDNWSDCLGGVQDDYNAMYNMLIAANAACRNGDDTLMRQILRDFYERLLGDQNAGYQAIEGPLQAGGDIRNTFAAIDIGAMLNVNAATGSAFSSLTSLNTMIVDSDLYLSEAAGPAASIKKAQSGNDPLIALGDPQPSYLQTTYSFTGGSLSVQVDGVTQTHSLNKGVLRYAEVPHGQTSRLVPTSFKWELSRNGTATTLTLDKACPYNEVVFLDATHGSIRVGVTIDSEAEAANRLEWLGALWVTLPFEIVPNGSMLIGTGGWEDARVVLPVSDMSEAVLVGNPAGNPPPLPNNREEACADVDGDGVRDGANELINLFTLGDCD